MPLKNKNYLQVAATDASGENSGPDVVIFILEGAATKAIHAFSHNAYPTPCSIPLAPPFVS